MFAWTLYLYKYIITIKVYKKPHRKYMHMYVQYTQSNIKNKRCKK